MSATPATTATQNKVELGLLEEDDEFEEFETEDWNEIDKDGDAEKEVNLWEDNWDDDNIEDDFTMQLRWFILVFVNEIWWRILINCR